MLNRMIWDEERNIFKLLGMLDNFISPTVMWGVYLNNIYLECITPYDQYRLPKEVQRCISDLIYSSPINMKSIAKLLVKLSEHIDISICTDLLKDLVDPGIYMYTPPPSNYDTEFCKIALEIYNTNDYSIIGILGDCLEDHNYKYKKHFIKHIRECKEHYTGCWAVRHFIQPKGNLQDQKYFHEKFNHVLLNKGIFSAL